MSRRSRFATASQLPAATVQQAIALAGSEPPLGTATVAAVTGGLQITDASRVATLDDELAYADTDAAPPVVASAEEPMPEHHHHEPAKPAAPVAAPPSETYTCLACGHVPGCPAYCRSCTSQARVNANPRVTVALTSRPPIVPFASWHAAIGALLMRRPPKCSPAAVMQLLDQKLPELRATMQAAFEAIK